MSKELVKPVKVPALKDSTGLVNLVKPENSVVSAGELFTSTVDSIWAREKIDTHFGVEAPIFVGFFTTVFGVAVSLGIGSLTGINGNEDFQNIIEASTGYVLGASGLVTTATAFFVRHFGKKQKRIFETSVSINQKPVVEWLYGRYGVKVSGNEAYMVSRYVSFGMAGLRFSDDEGKDFILQINDYKEYFIVDAPEARKPAESDIVDAVAPKIAETFLSGEALILGESIASRLEQLKSFDLSVESNHIVSRIEQDLKQAFQLHMKLHNLGRENLSDIVDILSELNQELNELIVGQVNDIKNEFAIQKRYIKSRQLHQSSPDLKLSVKSHVIGNGTKIEVVGNV